MILNPMLSAHLDLRRPITVAALGSSLVFGMLPRRDVATRPAVHVEPGFASGGVVKKPVRPYIVGEICHDHLVTRDRAEQLRFEAECDRELRGDFD